jgi:hypothetical protein
MNRVIRLCVLLGFVAGPLSAANGQEDNSPFSEGLCREARGAYIGFTDYSGKWVIPAEYPNATDFLHGMAQITGRGPGSDPSPNYTIDFSGKRLDPEVVNQVQFGLEPYSKDGKWGFVMKGTEKPLIEAKYDRVWEFSEGLALVSLVGEEPQYRWIDFTGRERIVLPDLKRGEPFHEGLARVQIENLGSDDNASRNKWGLIDRLGNFVARPEYDEIDDFKDGRARVRTDREYGYIDYAGKIVVPVKYRQVKEYSEGLAAVMVAETPRTLWGFVDLDGNLVIEGQYQRVRSFSHGMALVQDLNFQGFIDHSGNRIREAQVMILGGW